MQLVVVDSGSTDDTIATAEAAGAVVVRVARGEFSYGGALNRGAEAATGDIHVALSSHCELPRRDWVSIAVDHLSQPHVAAVTGKVHDSSGRTLTEPLVVRSTTEILDPYWSFSNHASAWRSDVWSRAAFDESLLACEDTEWADRVTHMGHSVVYDPRLVVAGDHRRAAGLRSLTRRHRKEVGAILAVRPGATTPTAASVLRRYASDHPEQYVRWKRFVSPYRMSELLGEYLAGRDFRRGRVPGPAGGVPLERDEPMP